MNLGHKCFKGRIRSIKGRVLKVKIFGNTYDISTPNPTGYKVNQDIIVAELQGRLKVLTKPLIYVQEVIKDLKLVYILSDGVDGILYGLSEDLSGINEIVDNPQEYNSTYGQATIMEEINTFSDYSKASRVFWHEYDLIMRKIKSTTNNSVIIEKPHDISSILKDSEGNSVSYSYTHDFEIPSLQYGHVGTYDMETFIDTELTVDPVTMSYIDAELDLTGLTVNHDIHYLRLNPDEIKANQIFFEIDLYQPLGTTYDASSNGYFPGSNCVQSGVYFNFETTNTSYEMYYLNLFLKSYSRTDFTVNKTMLDIDSDVVIVGRNDRFPQSIEDVGLGTREISSKFRLNTSGDLSGIYGDGFNVDHSSDYWDVIWDVYKFNVDDGVTVHEFTSYKAARNFCHDEGIPYSSVVVVENFPPIPESDYIYMRGGELYVWEGEWISYTYIYYDQGYYTQEGFPSSQDSSTLYYNLDNSTYYVWNGSSYVVYSISPYVGVDDWDSFTNSQPLANWIYRTYDLSKSEDNQYVYYKWNVGSNNYSVDSTAWLNDVRYYKYHAIFFRQYFNNDSLVTGVARMRHYDFYRSEFSVRKNFKPRIEKYSCEVRRRFEKEQDNSYIVKESKLNINDAFKENWGDTIPEYEKLEEVSAGINFQYDGNYPEFYQNNGREVFPIFTTSGNVDFQVLDGNVDVEVGLPSKAFYDYDSWSIRGSLDKNCYNKESFKVCPDEFDMTGGFSELPSYSYDISGFIVLNDPNYNRVEFLDELPTSSTDGAVYFVDETNNFYIYSEDSSSFSLHDKYFKIFKDYLYDKGMPEIESVSGNTITYEEPMLYGTYVDKGWGGLVSDFKIGSIDLGFYPEYDFFVSYGAEEVVRRYFEIGDFAYYVIQSDNVTVETSGYGIYRYSKTTGSTDFIDLFADYDYYFDVYRLGDIIIILGENQDTYNYEISYIIDGVLYQPLNYVTSYYLYFFATIFSDGFLSYVFDDILYIFINNYGIIVNLKVNEAKYFDTGDYYIYGVGVTSDGILGVDYTGDDRRLCILTPTWAEGEYETYDVDVRYLFQEDFDYNKDFYMLKTRCIKLTEVVT